MKTLLTILFSSLLMQSVAQQAVMDWSYFVTGGGSYLRTLSAVVDSSGNVYTSGFHFFDSADYDPGTPELILPAYPHNGFVSKIDKDGQVQWAKKFGSGVVRPATMDVTSNGSILTSGKFDDLGDFDPGAGVSMMGASQTSWNIFYLMLDSAGNYLWSGAIVGDEPNEEVIDLDLGTNGSIYSVGHFEETLDFDPGSGVFEMSSPDNEDIFIHKMTNDGEFVWAKQLSGQHNMNVYDIELGPNDEIFIAGKASLGADFDPDSGVVNATGTFPLFFLLKLDSNGAFNWLQTSQDSLGGWRNLEKIKVSDDGQLFVYGGFVGEVDFDFGVDSTIVDGGYRSQFLASYTLDGELNFVRKFGVMGEIAGDPTYSIARSISLDVDGFGNVVCYGSCGGEGDSLDLDPGPDTNLRIVNSAQGNMPFYVMIFDANGAFQYAAQFQHKPYVSIVDIFYTGMKTDYEGNLYSYGFSTDHSDLDWTTDSLEIVTNNIYNYRAAVVSKYSFCNTKLVADSFVCDSVLAPSGTKYWKTDGLHRDTLINAAGCDSMIAIQLSIGNDYAFDTASSCVSYTWPLNGATYSNSGTYHSAIPKASGCDSIVELALTIFEAAESQLEVDTCDSYFWENSGQTYFTSTVDTAFFTSSQGCDSLVILDLYIPEIDTSISSTDSSLILTQTGAAYQWHYCDSGFSVIAGEEDMTFMFSDSNATVAAVITLDGCSDTSACMPISALGNLGLQHGASFSVFPNPAKDYLHILPPSEEAFNVLLMNVAGKAVLELSGLRGAQRVVLNQPFGIYMLRIESSEQRLVRMVVVGR